MKIKKDFFGAFKGIGPFAKEDKLMLDETEFIEKMKKRSLEPAVKRIKSGFGISKGLASFSKEDKFRARLED